MLGDCNGVLVAKGHVYATRQDRLHDNDMRVLPGLVHAARLTSHTGALALQIDADVTSMSNVLARKTEKA